MHGVRAHCAPHQLGVASPDGPVVATKALGGWLGAIAEQVAVGDEEEGRGEDHVCRIAQLELKSAHVEDFDHGCPTEHEESSSGCRPVDGARFVCRGREKSRGAGSHAKERLPGVVAGASRV